MFKRLTPSMVALQCFEAAARHLSFARAAEELHLTPSAVSKQVAQLEEMLRHPLFHRVRRHLQLTSAGELYLTEVDNILTQVDTSSRYILSYGGQTEILRVATPPTFGARWLVPNLKDFHKCCPHIHLDIRSGLTPSDLLKAKADVAFFFGQGSWPGAVCTELFREDIVPVCSPDILAYRSIKSAAELIDLVLLQCTSRPDAWHDWFLEQGLPLERSHHGPRFDTFYMCIRAAKAGCGVALMPKFLVADEISEQKLVVAWDYSAHSASAHFIAYSKHAGHISKIHDFVKWALGQAKPEEHLP